MSDNDISIYIKDEFLFIRIYLKQELFLSNQKEIIKLINETMLDYNGLQSNIVSFNDEYIQNVTFLEEYLQEGNPIERITLKPGQENKKMFIEIDTEKNPGHYHITNNLWFGSCYMMWFGLEYFNYVPEEGFKTFKDCYENIDIGNRIRCITLYENVYDCDNPENRRRQWAFREATGIDEVAHELIKIEEMEYAKVAPTIEIKEPSKDTREIKTYLNEKGKMTPKNEATHVRVVIGKSGEPPLSVELREKRDDD